MSDYRRYSQVEDPETWGVGPAADPVANQSTGWAGWVWFAGIMMIMMGVFNAIEGLVALFKQEYYVVGPDSVLVFDLTGWGWINLIVGALVALTGIALFSDAGWARVVTVVLAGINAVAQLTFMAVYPVWSTIVIALCVLIIWAIVVHGKESRLDT